MKQQNVFANIKEQSIKQQKTGLYEVSQQRMHEKVWKRTLNSTYFLTSTHPANRGVWSEEVLGTVLRSNKHTDTFTLCQDVSRSNALYQNKVLMYLALFSV